MHAPSVIDYMGENCLPAYNVITNIFTHYAAQSYDILYDLADMNIRGFQLACAYILVCGKDVDTLIDLSSKRDFQMVQKINAALRDIFPFRAVQYGALKAVDIPIFDSMKD